MKVIVLASLTLSLFLNLSVAARDVSIDLRVIQQNVNVGDEIAANVNIDPVSDLRGINILISFDNRVLEYQSITHRISTGEVMEDIVPDPEIVKGTGEIEYLAIFDSHESPGSGIDFSNDTILTLSFVARAPGEAWIKLEPNDVCLGNSMANVIPTIIDTDRDTAQIGEVFEMRVFNYPNPASDGRTVIRCEARALLEKVEAMIYDISGQLVREINYEDFDDTDAPVYEYEWDCRNGKERDVANGVYILWLKASFSEEKQETKTWKIAVRR